MRLTIHHQTTYTYAKPARRAVEALRLTPRGHNGQFVVDWRIDVDKDCRLQRTIDAFGNTLHNFTVEGPLSGLVITASGSIETQEVDGVLRGQIERLPPAVFLRDTQLTAADAAIRDFAEAVGGNAQSSLDGMHRLMGSINDRLIFDTTTTGPGTGASEAFALGHGVCQDFAHIFVAAARHVGVPARYVSGYLYRSDGQNLQPAGHAWAEALVEGLGWVGFDPANGVAPGQAYVRVAVGLDALGASPIRGARTGGEGEVLAVTVKVESGGPERRSRVRQVQRQTQS